MIAALGEQPGKRRLIGMRGDVDDGRCPARDRGGTHSRIQGPAPRFEVRCPVRREDERRPVVSGGRNRLTSHHHEPPPVPRVPLAAQREPAPGQIRDLRGRFASLQEFDHRVVAARSRDRADRCRSIRRRMDLDGAAEVADGGAGPRDRRAADHQPLLQRAAGRDDLAKQPHHLGIGQRPLVHRREAPEQRRLALRAIVTGLGFAALDRRHLQHHVPTPVEQLEQLGVERVDPVADRIEPGVAIGHVERPRGQGDTSASSRRKAPRRATAPRAGGYVTMRKTSDCMEGRRISGERSGDVEEGGVQLQPEPDGSSSISS